MKTRLNLAVHCGARRVERQEVDSSETPNRTSTWVPVGHGAMLNHVESSLSNHGLRVVDSAHALWGEGSRYFGLMHVASTEADNDYGTVLGLRNSHDKSFPACIGLGSGVFVCDNLAFSAEVKIARRHTRFIERDLPQLVDRAIGQLGELRVSQSNRIAAYKDKRISNKAAHDLLIRGVDSRVLPVTKLPKAIAEWREPSHPEFAMDGRTAWRLFNAFTEAVKGNLAALPRRTQVLHGMFDSAVGLN